MVRAYHLILSAYGFWLPNDSRGSWSRTVRNPDLRLFGPATKVETHRSVAHVPHDAGLRRRAKAAIRYAPTRFTGRQAREVGRAFAELVTARGWPVYACTILPDHAHLVIGRVPIRIEQVARQFKQVSTQRLREAGMDPMDGSASPWARGCWHVFLHTDADVRRTMRYVEENPVRAGLPRQRWSFVTAWEGE